MNNLIVTIIAISLAAAMAAASVYYGGNAYVATNATASATQIVNYLANYQQAIKMWSQRNGGSPPNPSINFPVTPSGGGDRFSKSEVDSFLTSRYIQTNNVPTKFTTSSFFIYFSTNIMQNPVVVGFLGSSNLKICNAIETLRTGNTPTLRTWAATASQINHLFCGNFGCLINDGSWGSTSTYTYVVYYRLNGLPNTNYSDVNPVTCN